MRLPILGSDDDTANREYTRQFVLDRDAETGKKFGLAYGEPYHYIGPPAAKVEDYVRRNSVKPVDELACDVIRQAVQSRA